MMCVLVCVCVCIHTVSGRVGHMLLHEAAES